MTATINASPILAILLAACVSHRVQSDPIEIKPIHITMDINVRVQRELDEFFDFEESDAKRPVDADSQRAQEGK
jgi:hypothetical protein